MENTVVSDTIGQNYDKVKSLYNTYTSHVNIKKTNKKETTYLDQLFIYVFNWKIVFLVLLLVALCLLVVLRKIYENIKELSFYDTYGLEVISFSLYIIAINLFFAVFLEYYDLVHWQWQWTWAQKMNVLQNAYLEISFYLHGLRIYLREVSVLWCICTTSGGNTMPILMESAMLVTPQVKLFLVGDQTYRLFKEGMIFNLYELVRTLDMGQAISNSTWNLFCEKLF